MFRKLGFIFRKTACIGLSSLVGRRVCSIINTVYTTIFLKLEPRVRNM